MEQDHSRDDMVRRACSVARRDYMVRASSFAAKHSGASGTCIAPITAFQSLVTQGLQGQAILDLGCGSGKQMFDVFLPKKPAVAVGIELSQAFVEMAKAQSKAHRETQEDPRAPQPRFEQGDMHSVLMQHPDLRDSFDIVCSCYVVHYSADLTAVFSSCWQMLKPGGELVFLVNMTEEEELPDSVRANRSMVIKLGEDFFLNNNIYTKKEYLEVLTVIGFDVDFASFPANPAKFVRDHRNAHFLTADGEFKVEVTNGLFHCVRPLHRPSADGRGRRSVLGCLSTLPAGLCPCCAS